MKKQTASAAVLVAVNPGESAWDYAERVGLVVPIIGRDKKDYGFAAFSSDVCGVSTEDEDMASDHLFSLFLALRGVSLNDGSEIVVDDDGRFYRMAVELVNGNNPWAILNLDAEDLRDICVTWRADRGLDMITGDLS